MKKTGNQIISLDGKWTLKYSDSTSGDSGEIEALVPGNVELDLMRAGLLPEDLFRGDLRLELYKAFRLSGGGKQTFQTCFRRSRLRGGIFFKRQTNRQFGQYAGGA